MYLLGDSGFKLLKAEHPTIQTNGLFGRRVWLGWIMIAALIYSIFPPLILGHMKMPLAPARHQYRCDAIGGGLMPVSACP